MGDNECKGKVGATLKSRMTSRLWAMTSARESGWTSTRAGDGNFKENEHNSKEGGG